MVRHALEEYLRELEQQAGDQHVYSPVLGKRELYEISGHWSHYRDGMYPPMETASVGSPSGRREQAVPRPSRAGPRAARPVLLAGLPRAALRLAELGGQYRPSRPGAGGLNRVRAMQLNDEMLCNRTRPPARPVARWR